MKIAYIASGAIPIKHATNSVQVMKMGQAFSQIGNDVVVIAPNGAGTMRDVDPFEFYGVEKTFELKRGPFISVKGRNIFYGLYAAVLAKISHADFVYGRSKLGCYFSSLLGLPVGIEIHDPPPSYAGKILALLMKRPQLRGVFVTTSALRDLLVSEYKAPPDLVFVVPNAADVPAKSPSPFTFRTGKFNVGFVGNLQSGKGMEIIAELIKKCEWAHFHIVGGTEKDLAAWRPMTDRNKNATLYGYVSPAETEKYRQACDVLLAPNLPTVLTHSGMNIGQWTSPLKIFEYMASGKAILASDLPVLREVLQDGRNALLRSPGRIDQWVEGLEELYKNRELTERLGQTAERDFFEKHTWQARAKRIIGLIDSRTKRDQ
jgi:glycosyltransferase involved in cell wall biosynthesis